MAGTINLSMTQQFDPLGNPLSGGKLYGIVAGTVSTPQNYFQDLALTLPWPNPITLDVAGRVPQLFIADGLIKIRLTNSAGVVQLSADNIQVIGASSGGGGGGAIDATTVLQTGDIKPRYGTGGHTGWVRANAKTIGSAISGATERANADTQALFQFLWGVDTNLVVIGGRGSTSLADWNANKQMTLPDGRGVTLAGLDDMGNTAAGRLSTYFGVGTVLGTIGGAQSHTLSSTEQASMSFSASTGGASNDHAHAFSGTTDGENVGHTHGTSVAVGANTGPLSGSANVYFGGNTGANTAGESNSHVHTFSGGTGGRNADHTHTVSGTAAGGGQPHTIVQPTMVVTIYIKL
jgi:hypothetical protein